MVGQASDKIFDVISKSADLFYQHGLLLPSEHRVLLHLLSRKILVVEIKNSDVAKELNMSRTTVIKALRQLTKRSIICSAFDPQVVSKSKGRLYKIMPPKTWKKYRVLIK